MKCIIDFIHFLLKQIITKLHTSSMKNNKAEIYWKKNLRYLTILLSIWFLVSFGFGILLADQLNEIQFFGFKLGFWFAQQGSIYTFVILIFVYIFLMNRLDKFYRSKK